MARVRLGDAPVCHVQACMIAFQSKYPTNHAESQAKSEKGAGNANVGGDRYVKPSTCQVVAANRLL